MPVKRARNAVERRASVKNVHDVLYGGPDQPGLVHIVAELSKNITTLAGSVKNVCDVVLSSNGLETQVKQLAEEVHGVKTELQTLKNIGFAILGVLAIVGIIAIIYGARYASDLFAHRLVGPG